MGSNMYRFGLFCSFAAWLIVLGQGLAPTAAQDADSCGIDVAESISASSNNPMLPTPSLLATQLESASTDSRIVVKCTEASSGYVRLSINTINTNGSSNEASLKLSGVSGFFTAQSNDYPNNFIDVPFNSSQDQPTGEIRYQVRIVSPNGYYLPAANNYSVGVRAKVIAESSCPTCQ
jgi:hypothetical protein